jgi:DNA-binding transcriptional MerR regulator
MRIFKSKEIQKLSGASKIQLVHWINIGAIEPYEDDRRRGGVRKYDQQNLIEACICKKLNDLKIPAHSIASALKHLRKPESINNPEGLIFWDIFKKTYKKKRWYLILMPSSEHKDYKKIADAAKLATRRPELELDPYFIAYASKSELYNYLDHCNVAVVADLNKIAEAAGGG